MAGRNPRHIFIVECQTLIDTVQPDLPYDEAVAALEELLAKKKAMQNEELLRLFADSSRTYGEVAAFLKEGMTEEQLLCGIKKKPGRKPKTEV